METVPADPLLPSLDHFGSLFTACAVKWGGSEVKHLDHGDHPGLCAWIVVLGDFKAGEFILPHLRLKIPLSSGDLLIVNARSLLHGTGPYTGNRFVITGFIDYNTALHAGIDEDMFWNYNITDQQYTAWLKDRIASQIAAAEAKEAAEAAKVAAAISIIEAGGMGSVKDDKGRRRSARHGPIQTALPIHPGFDILHAMGH